MLDAHQYNLQNFLSNSRERLDMFIFPYLSKDNRFFTLLLQVTFVSCLLSFKHDPVDTIFLIDDFTGIIHVLYNSDSQHIHCFQWVCHLLYLQPVWLPHRPDMFVYVTGDIKSKPCVKFIKVCKIRPLDGLEEISFHVLAVVATHCLN